MNLTQKLLNDIYHEIESKNKEMSPQSIPHSDSFAKHMLAAMGLSPENLRRAILLLCDAHRIFSMEIVAQDSNRGIDRVEGYIVTDRFLIGNLKSYFQDLLCQLYEKQFNKHLLVHQVIKEIFPIIKSFNNTDLGQVANKTIMLMEYERLIEKDPLGIYRRLQRKENDRDRDQGEDRLHTPRRENHYTAAARKLSRSGSCHGHVTRKRRILPRS